ncbi:12425_t:CDS:2, partial [Acaulospora morrowiae]
RLEHEGVKSERKAGVTEAICKALRYRKASTTLKDILTKYDDITEWHPTGIGCID